MRSVMFADDTNLIIKGKDLCNLKEAVSHDIENLVDFFRANKIKLNVEKTKMICFRKKNIDFDKDQLQVTLENEKLELVDETVFLGMTIDCHLTWEKHCHDVANKVSRTTGILGRVKNFLPATALRTIYDSLLMSHIQYGLEIWGGCNSSKGKKRLVGTHKKAVRHLSKSHYMAHTEPRMKSLGLLKIEDQHLLQNAALAHDIINKHGPTNLQDSFDLYTDSHDYSLRSVTDNPLGLRETLSNTRQIKHGFSSLGPRIWNSIPENIRQIKNRKSFKRHLKKHILEGYVDKLTCVNPLCRDKRFHLH